jgi:hypothetical protein
MTSPAEAAGLYNALAETEGWHSACYAALDLRRRDLVDMLAIWRRFAAQASVPMRRDLTPRILRAHLSDVAIYERSQDGARYRIRVMGTRMASVLGDLSGRYVDEAVPARFLKRWHAAPDAVLAAGAPLRFVSRTETVGKPFITGEYLMLPLIGDTGSMDTVLSCAAYGPTVTPSRR